STPEIPEDRSSPPASPQPLIQELQVRTLPSPRETLERQQPDTKRPSRARGPTRALLCRFPRRGRARLILQVLCPDTNDDLETSARQGPQELAPSYCHALTVTVHGPSYRSPSAAQSLPRPVLREVPRHQCEREVL